MVKQIKQLHIKRKFYRGVSSTKKQFDRIGYRRIERLVSNKIYDKYFDELYLNKSKYTYGERYELWCRKDKLCNYNKREYGCSVEIEKHKIRINIKFAELIKQHMFSNSDINFPRILILDTDEEQTRNILKDKCCLHDDQIRTVNINTKTIKRNIHKTSLKRHLLNKTTKSYNHMWLDAIFGPKKALKHIELVCERNLLENNGIFVITLCLRGCPGYEFNQFQDNLLYIGYVNNIEFDPIIVDDNLRLPAGGYAYTILSNMADNGTKHYESQITGEKQKHGRVVTCFYRYTKNS